MIDHLFYYWCIFFLFCIGGIGGWLYAHLLRKEVFDRLAQDLAASLPDSLGKALEESRAARDLPQDELDRLRRELADKDKDLTGLEHKLMGDGATLGQRMLDAERERQAARDDDEAIGELEQALAGTEAALSDAEKKLAAARKGLEDKERFIR